MTQEGILNMIVDEVVRRLQARKKRALVIFTGAAIGFQDVIPCLKKLLNDGWDLRIFLSKSGEYVFTPQLIKEQLGVKEVFLESEVISLRDLYKDVGSFIIPTLTLNTAAKVSLGLADTMATNLIAHGIMEGIPMIAAKDGCDLSNHTRLSFGMNKTPQSYLSTFEEHLRKVESYGIKLVEAKEIYDTMTSGKAFLRSVGNETNNLSIDDLSLDNSSKDNTLKDKSSNSSLKLTKKVISRSDVMNTRNNYKVLEVSKGTIITPLALEAAREVGLQIKQVH